MDSAQEDRVSVMASGESVVVDVFVDLYVAWRERSAQLDAVYRQWDRASMAAHRRDAFIAYSRALDDEEGAARRFEDFAAYAARMLSV